VAFLVPDRRALARVLRARVTLDDHAAHGVSEAIYLRVPDGDGIEIYRDHPEADRPRAEAVASRRGIGHTRLAAQGEMACGNSSSSSTTRANA
jgi:catechol-2,3-dioxygenase